MQGLLCLQPAGASAPCMACSCCRIRWRRMVFITHCWKRRTFETLGRACLLAFCGLFLGTAQAASISYKAVAIGEEDGWIVLDLLQNYKLSETMDEALQNGVPLTFETEVIVDPEDAAF
ncbi:MAG TPA: DUF4390 domain-containing protein, partial [Chromatiaceae bacterium]|nr:DUF4390 domain-containing protein [Chromatiaceae bacterium]